MSERILVQRFKSLYWPEALCQDFADEARVLAATPVTGYMHGGRNEFDYHWGRIHYFYQTLKSGGSLDPIEIDWIWYGTSPVEITLRDGHHRFIAAVLAKKRRITADYSGPVDVVEWLEGKAKKRPAWL